MPYNEAQKKATMKWIEAHDDVRLRVPKGTKAKWKKYAEAHGMSMTSFVVKEMSKIIGGDKEYAKKIKNNKC